MKVWIIWANLVGLSLGYKSNRSPMERERNKVNKSHGRDVYLGYRYEETKGKDNKSAD